MYAHLSHDPVHSMVTPQQAQAAGRWVERKHAPGPIRV